MTLRFSKMHGLGNDFVVINNLAGDINWKSLPIKRICDRHLGIGCDQVLIIEKAKHADFFCRILNADGSQAEQCGNGLRCVARYLHEQNIASSSIFTLETMAGVFPVSIKDYETISVTLPIPQLTVNDCSIPISPDQALHGKSLSLGNPHLVIEVDEVASTPVIELGKIASTHTSFPNGVNVGFMQKVSNNHIILRTFERGSGQTHACGSNACAAVASGIHSGLLDKRVDVEFTLGKLRIEWLDNGSALIMTGPASLVFTGVYTI